MFSWVASLDNYVMWLQKCGGEEALIFAWNGDDNAEIAQLRSF